MDAAIVKLEKTINMGELAIVVQFLGVFPASFEGPPGCINYFDIHARPELSRLGSAVQLSSCTVVIFLKLSKNCEAFCQYNQWNPTPFHQLITLSSKLLVFTVRKGPFNVKLSIFQYLREKKAFHNFWKKSSNSGHCGRRYSDPPELIKIGKCS